MSHVPDFYRMAKLTDVVGEPIATASLRSPVNAFEEVDSYPVPYVLLDEVFTAPDYRRHGLARGLIRLLLEEATRQGWAVFCRPSGYGRGKMDRKALFAFYERLGWRADPHQQLNEDWLVRVPPLRLVFTDRMSK